MNRKQRRLYAKRVKRAGQEHTHWSGIQPKINLRPEPPRLEAKEGPTLMFYCDPDGAERGWPTSDEWPLARSYGRCEICGETRVCNDLPRRLLPEPSDEYRWRPESRPADQNPDLPPEHGHVVVNGVCVEC